MDIFPEKPKASRLSPGSPQFPLIPRARWSRKVKSPALQNRGQGTQIRLTPLRPGHPSCNLRVIQAQIQPPHQIPNRTYAVLFLYQLLHIYCSQQHLPPIYRYQPWNTVLCSLHARSLHTSIPSAASISSHVPDGTFPPFRKNVHRESMPFFESQLLTHPRSSRSLS